MIDVYAGRSVTVILKLIKKDMPDEIKFGIWKKLEGLKASEKVPLL